jgi:hypothetical protein
MKEARLDEELDLFKLPDKFEKDNPGMDLVIWKRLRKRWAELEKAGHKLKVDFHLLADVDDENNILAIDVVQNINEELITETVQRSAGEADTMLGIAGLSREHLVKVYKEMMHQLHQQAQQTAADLTVTMSPTSLTSGEVSAHVKEGQSGRKSSVLVNYQHY